MARLFLRLSLTAFGGPVAHIAIAEDEIVQRRKWLTHEHYLDLIAATMPRATISRQARVPSNGLPDFPRNFGILSRLQDDPPSLLPFDHFRKLVVRAVARFYPPPIAISVFVSPESVFH